MQASTASDTELFKRRVIALFPYPTMKTTQQILVNSISKSNMPMLISTNTGVGKTAAIIGSFLALRKEGDRILIFVRTKAQIDVYLRELSLFYKKLASQKKLLKSQLDPFPLFLPLVGKKELCIRFNERFPAALYSNICTLTKCPLKAKTQDLSNKKIIELAKIFYNDLTFFQSYEELYSKLKNRGICPYIFGYFLLQKADIIITTHSFLQNESLFEKLFYILNTPINNLLIAIDEAHNLYSPYSDEISYGVALNAVKESDYKVFREFLSKFKEETIFKFNVNEEILEQIGKELFRKLSLELSNNGKPPISSFLIYRFLTSANGKTLLSNKESIKLIQFSPASFLHKLKDAKKLVLISGSFEPLTSFRKLFELKKAHLLRIFPAENSNAKYYVITSKKFDGTYNNRDDNYYNEITAAITSLAEDIPSHTIVFVPSYNYLAEIAARISYKENILMEEKEQDTKMIEAILRNSAEKKIVLSIMGGKISEGVEFTKNGRSIISGVVITTLPYPPPSFENQLYFQELLKKYGKRLATEFAFTIPMLQKLQQSFGRAIRNTNEDKAVHVILDPRATKYSPYFHFERFNSVELLKKKISSFFNNH